MTLHVPGVSGFDLGMALVRTLVQDRGATVLEYGATPQGVEIELAMATRTNIAALEAAGSAAIAVRVEDQLVALTARSRQSKLVADGLIERSRRLALETATARGEHRTLLSIARHELGVIREGRSARAEFLTTSRSPTD